MKAETATATKPGVSPFRRGHTAQSERKRLAAYRSTVAARSRDPKARFLRAFRKHLTVAHACHVAAIDRTSVYRWRREDEEFASRFKVTQDLVVEQLEQVALDRARRGLSDRLLIWLLKHWKPETYNPETVSRHTNLSVTASLSREAVKKLSSEELSWARHLARRLRGESAGSRPPSDVEVEVQPVRQQHEGTEPVMGSMD